MWNEFDKMVTQLFNMQQVASQTGHCSTTPWGYPQTGMTVDGEEVTFTAEIPGVKKEDLTLEIKSNHLHLKGSRKTTLAEEETLLHSERSKVDFDQSYKLPFAVEAGEAKATFEDGVLEIKLSRAESDKPLAIEIN